MLSFVRRTPILLGIIALVCAAPLTVEWSSQSGVAFALNDAQARVGRPLTPGSVAGVARRTTRRTVRRHAVYGHHHHCVWVNGVQVCS